MPTLPTRQSVTANRQCAAEPHDRNRLGFWSAALTTFLTALFFVSLVVPSQNLMFASSFLLAPAFVAMMVSIHHYATPEKKVWNHLGLSLAVIYAVMGSLTYYIQLTFVQNNYLPVAEEAVLPFVFLPGTPIFAQDMLGYVFMCAATLAAGFVFTGDKLETWIKWLFILNGVLFIVPTLIVPAIPLPVNETGTGVGDLVGRYAHTLGFLTFGLALVTLAGVNLPILVNDRAAFYALAAARFFACSLGMAKISMEQGWTDPITIAGMILGA
ncbi:MAG: hypothetical protein AB1649_29215, partial [Chloroflexota bacterium]